MAALSRSTCTLKGVLRRQEKLCLGVLSRREDMLTLSRTLLMLGTFSPLSIVLTRVKPDRISAVGRFLSCCFVLWTVLGLRLRVTKWLAVSWSVTVEERLLLLVALLKHTLLGPTVKVLNARLSSIGWRHLEGPLVTRVVLPNIWNPGQNLHPTNLLLSPLLATLVTLLVQTVGP